MSDAGPDTPKPAARRWLLPVLFLSLALNLLVVGVFVGRLFAPMDSRKGERIAGPIRSVVGEPFVRALTREDRRAMLAEFKREGPRIRESREALRRQVQAFLAALRSDPFDPDEVRRLMQNQRQSARSRQALGETLLLNRLQDMSGEERAAYADRLEKSLKNLRRR